MGRRRKIDARLVQNKPATSRASMFICARHGCDVGFTETYAPTPDGLALKKAREERGMTPAQVGRLFGLRYDEIEGLEEGHYSFMAEGIFSSLMATLEGKVPAKPAREESKSVAASRKVILYRGKEFEDEELEAARAAGFFCTNSRMDIRPGDVCIPRYSALPFYEEQERDIHRVGALRLNTQRGHD